MRACVCVSVLLHTHTPPLMECVPWLQSECACFAPFFACLESTVCLCPPEVTLPLWNSCMNSCHANSTDCGPAP